MVSSSIILKNQEIITITQFLELYNEINKINSDNILKLEFNLDCSVLERYGNSARICPIVEIAKPENAAEIAQIFRDVYHGTYPYKKMENADSITKMIKDPTFYWFIFKVEQDEIVGAFGSHVEFEERRGQFYGFVIKEGYHKLIDVFKAFLGCVIYLWKKHRKEILLWYGETITSHNTTQYFTNVIGMKPIAFFPNKDLFFNKKESDIFHVIYEQKILKSLRKKSQPILIRQVLNSYSYANNRYNLGLPLIKNPDIKLDLSLLKELKEKITFSTEELENNSMKVRFQILDSDSFFECVHNPYSKNLEKTSYKVNSIEELHVILNELLKLIKEWDLNYFECFVSAYKPEYQKIFYDFGFKPRGYVPSWKYNKSTHLFEDFIVFNFYKGEIDENIRIIPEVMNLLNVLNVFDQKYLETKTIRL